MLSVFFEKSFLETFPLTFADFQNSICLRFLFGGFFATKSDLGVRGFSGRIKFLSQKCPLCSPKTATRKVLPFLALVFGVLFFVTARFSGGFCATNSVFCRGGVFVGFGRAFLYGLFTRLREFFFRRFRASGAVVSGPAFLFFSPLPHSSSPFLLLGPAWAALLFFCAPCCQDCRRRRQVRRSIAHAMLLFFFLLSLPGRPHSPFPSFFSFFLSLSLSCMHLASRALRHKLGADYALLFG